MTKKAKAVSVPKGGVFSCAMCGSQKIKTSLDDYSFSYGTGANKVELSAKIPVRVCEDCGFTYRDSVADAKCHEAVCRHLNVMTPDQIKSLRKKIHDLTQADFAKITRLGEATISRWERGVLIQNEAYDNYLYLLGWPDNLNKLAQRAKGEPPCCGAKDEISAESHLTRQVPTGFPAFKCKGVYAR